MFEKIKRMVYAHPLLMSFVASVLIGMVGICFLHIIFLDFPGDEIIAAIFYEIITGALIGCFLIYPLVLTGTEICLLIFSHKKEALHRYGRLFDIVTIFLGIFYSILYLAVIKAVVFSGDWMEVLENAQKHTPVFTQALPTVLTITAVGFTGYMMVNYIPLKKMPPSHPGDRNSRHVSWHTGKHSLGNPGMQRGCPRRILSAVTAG